MATGSASQNIEELKSALKTYTTNKIQEAIQDEAIFWQNIARETALKARTIMQMSKNIGSMLKCPSCLLQAFNKTVAKIIPTSLSSLDFGDADKLLVGISSQVIGVVTTSVVTSGEEATYGLAQRAAKNISDRSEILKEYIGEYSSKMEQIVTLAQQLDTNYGTEWRTGMEAGISASPDLLDDISETTQTVIDELEQNSVYRKDYVTTIKTKIGEVGQGIAGLPDSAQNDAITLMCQILELNQWVRQNMMAVKDLIDEIQDAISGVSTIEEQSQSIANLELSRTTKIEMLKNFKTNVDSLNESISSSLGEPAWIRYGYVCDWIGTLEGLEASTERLLPMDMSGSTQGTEVSQEVKDSYEVMRDGLGGVIAVDSDDLVMKSTSFSNTASAFVSGSPLDALDSAAASLDQAMTDVENMANDAAEAVLDFVNLDPITDLVDEIFGLLAEFKLEVPEYVLATANLFGFFALNIFESAWAGKVSKALDGLANGTGNAALQRDMINMSEKMRSEVRNKIIVATTYTDYTQNVISKVSGRIKYYKGLIEYGKSLMERFSSEEGLTDFIWDVTDVLEAANASQSEDRIPPLGDS